MWINNRTNTNRNKQRKSSNICPLYAVQSILLSLLLMHMMSCCVYIIYLWLRLDCSACPHLVILRVGLKQAVLLNGHWGRQRDSVRPLFSFLLTAALHARWGRLGQGAAAQPLIAHTLERNKEQVVVQSQTWSQLFSIMVRRLTSSRVSSCGVAALSSESFCEPGIASMFFLVPSRFFLCLWASFLTWPSALPELSRRTGLVSHFLSVFPGRLGPGELWGPSVWLEPGCRASLLDTDKVSEWTEERERSTSSVTQTKRKEHATIKEKNKLFSVLHWLADLSNQGLTMDS